MRQNDARQLSHDMLEDMRRRAVMAVQEGKSPEAVGKAFGLNRTTIYDWLAQYRRGGWGCFKSQAVGRAPAEAQRQADEVDLQHGYAEEPAANEILICLVDASDGGEANQGQIRHPAGDKLGWPSAGTARHHTAKAVIPGAGTRSVAGQEMAEDGISEDQESRGNTGGGHLFWRCGAYPLGSSCRPHLGQERRNAHCGNNRSSAWHELALGDYLEGPHAVYDQGKRWR